MATSVVKATRSDEVFTHQFDVQQSSVMVLKLEGKNNKNQLSKQSIPSSQSNHEFLPDTSEYCFSFLSPPPPPFLLISVPPTNSVFPPVMWINSGKGRYFNFTNTFPKKVFLSFVLMLDNFFLLLSIPKRIDTLNLWRI